MLAKLIILKQKPGLLSPPPKKSLFDPRVQVNHIDTSDENLRNLLSSIIEGVKKLKRQGKSSADIDQYYKIDQAQRKPWNLGLDEESKNNLECLLLIFGGFCVLSYFVFIACIVDVHSPYPFHEIMPMMLLFSFCELIASVIPDDKKVIKNPAVVSDEMFQEYIKFLKQNEHSLLYNENQLIDHLEIPLRRIDKNDEKAEIKKKEILEQYELENMQIQIQINQQRSEKSQTFFKPALYPKLISLRRDLERSSYKDLKSCRCEFWRFMLILVGIYAVLHVIVVPELYYETYVYPERAGSAMYPTFLNAKRSFIDGLANQIGASFKDGRERATNSPITFNEWEISSNLTDYILTEERYYRYSINQNYNNASIVKKTSAILYASYRYVIALCSYDILNLISNLTSYNDSFRACINGDAYVNQAIHAYNAVTLINGIDTIAKYCIKFFFQQLTLFFRSIYEFRNMVIYCCYHIYYYVVGNESPISPIHFHRVSGNFVLSRIYLQ